MRGFLTGAAVVGALGLLVHGASGETASTGKTESKKAATTHKKTTAARTGTRKSSTTVHKKTGATASHSSRTASSKRGKNTRRTTWRNRQLAPTPDRYKQIQEALAAKGYLAPDQANGQWSDTSTAALKKFQTDQNINPSGKIDSLSLIALGLGPKHETVAAQKPEPSAVPSKPE